MLDLIDMYVCMYLLIGKGQSAQKRPYLGGNRIKRKKSSKHMSLIVLIIEFALLCYRCDREWQTVPVFNNPARKTASSSAGSPGLLKKFY